MTSAVGSRTLLDALGEVRDPELDEPITALGFVASAELSGDGAAEVHLRLPTYFCAPNFAYLMVADAYDAVRTVDGVRRAAVVLDDHFAADAINDGVAARTGFAGSFAGEAAGELDGLRADFLRKAVLAGADQVCRPLVDAGATPGDLAGMTVGAVPPSPALERLLRRRSELGLPCGPGAPLLVEPRSGAPVAPDQVPLHLRKARVTRTSLDANTGICRGMLRHRYDTDGQGEEDR